MPDNTQTRSDSDPHSLSLVPYLSPCHYPLICLLVPWTQDLGWGVVYDEMREDYMRKRSTTLFSNSPVHQQWILHILNSSHPGLEDSTAWVKILAEALMLSLYSHEVPQLHIPHLHGITKSTYIFDKLSTSGLHNRPRVPNATYAVIIDVRCGHTEQSNSLALALKFITRDLPASMGIELDSYVAGLTYVYQPDGVTGVIYCTNVFDEVYQRVVERCRAENLNAYMSTGLDYGPSPYPVMQFPANQLPEDEIIKIHHRAIDLAIW